MYANNGVVHAVLMRSWSFRSINLEFSFAYLADTSTAMDRINPSIGVIPDMRATVVSTGELPLNLVNQARNDK
jgi:hypothetical protein